jgi:nucleoside-diphosphate-sugar epimerase
MTSALNVFSGSEIKRVVVTSSLAAVTSDTKTPRVYTEEDWNDATVKVVEEKGAEAGVGAVYSASKVLAERGQSIHWRIWRNFLNQYC